MENNSMKAKHIEHRLSTCIWGAGLVVLSVDYAQQFCMWPSCTQFIHYFFFFKKRGLARIKECLRMQSSGSGKFAADPIIWYK